MTLTPTNPAMEDICSHASEEQQFEYILSCAQRVGFDSFDTMATRYYARNFDPSSTLALEQRRSRNRRLPDLLAELRKCSIHWSTWQRRGYQDETLKAAEEICAIEYNEYRKRQETGVGGADVDEKELEESLPNLWALLMGLASNNPQLNQRNLPEAVFMSMRLLCGLEHY
ncbi:hypothetical protein F5X97DRAFT_307955 [Nemania serpens]|nr:hypothetical protein F5X97DRAFT_307955 [Nemania serpens]